MTALDSTPTNKNFLSQLKFRFQMMRAPHVEFFLQDVNIPTIRLPPTKYPNPFVDIPEPGDHLQFEPLHIRFKVDVDLQNYSEIYSWMFALGKLGDYTALRLADPMSGQGIKSELALMLLTGTSMPNYVITFHDAFPYELGELKFTTTAEDVEFESVSASFMYTYFDFRQVV